MEVKRRRREEKKKRRRAEEVGQFERACSKFRFEFGDLALVPAGEGEKVPTVSEQPNLSRIMLYYKIYLPYFMYLMNTFAIFEVKEIVKYQRFLS